MIKDDDSVVRLNVEPKFRNMWFMFPFPNVLKK